MNFYQLDDKKQDSDFLAGMTLPCPAAFSREALASGGAQPGKKVVIRLTTGAKYMGRIIDFTPSSDNPQEGILTFARDKSL